MDDRDRGRRSPGFRHVGVGLSVAVVIAALAVGALYLHHRHRLAAEAHRREREAKRGLKVLVAVARRRPGLREITLPADVRGFYQTTLYAKVAGYVRAILVDKGDSVKQGQLLATLTSPEIDQQVSGARADLMVKRRTFERYSALVRRDFVSRQDLDTARSQFEVAEAVLQQTRALQAYTTLRAPFSGTITTRYVDPGALVPAATGSTQASLPVVDLADLSRLRIVVYVQEDAAPFIDVGDHVTLTIDHRPDLHIDATVSRLSRALDPRTRTMLCEIWLPNRYQLYPGSFMHATIRLKGRAVPAVPSSALMVHDSRPSVALIGRQDARVHFVPVRVGVDDGKEVEILEGVHEGDQVALNLPAEVPGGAPVQTAVQKPEP
jgi:RND family efflux transporter MFP subunit